MSQELKKQRIKYLIIQFKNKPYIEFIHCNILTYRNKKAMFFLLSQC